MRAYDLLFWFASLWYAFLVWLSSKPRKSFLFVCFCLLVLSFHVFGCFSLFFGVGLVWASQQPTLPFFVVVLFGGGGVIFLCFLACCLYFVFAVLCWLLLWLKQTYQNKNSRRIVSKMFGHLGGEVRQKKNQETNNHPPPPRKNKVQTKFLSFFCFSSLIYLYLFAFLAFFC